ncbi:hypothetical protein UPYG_G00025440 [Umbra pygmaea]|uniref:RAP domain-containing protein n=1 Tax=Umbra pygmaea TaxID=75934 RepID=A0ABD0XLV4_UMBPY
MIMTARTAEEVFKRVLQMFGNRSQWQHTGTQMLSAGCVLANESFYGGPSHICSTRQSHWPLGGLPIFTVRFYSQYEIDVQDVVKTKQGHDVQRSEKTSPKSQLHSEQAAKRVSFYDHLSECKSPSDVLDLAGRYTSTHRRVSNCLTRCWETTKKMTEDQRRYELRLMFEHAGFEDLLQNSMKDAQRMRSEDLTYSLLAMVKLGVPVRSRVVQTLIRVCQENLNEFDEKSLSVLASSLEHMESSPNVDALKDGVRLIIEAKLPRIQTIVALQTLMRHIGRNASVDLKKKMERKALSLAAQFTLPNAQYMIITLASMGFCSKPLLDVCSKTIAAHVHGVPFNRLMKVLMSCKELNYRDLVLFTAISDYVGSTIDMWNNRQVILFLSAFEDLSYCPTAILDAFAERVSRNPEALGLKDVLSVLKTYSSLNHDLQEGRDLFLESMTKMVEFYMLKVAASDLLKVVYYLCVLGHFPAIPLEQLLLQDTMEKIGVQGGRLQKGMEKKLQLVDLCLRLDRPSLPNPLTIQAEALGALDLNDLVVNAGLSRTLRSLAQDGLLHVVEGVVVEDRYFIDGVITLLEATGGSTLSVREALLPEQRESRMAVFCAPPSSFGYGTSRPRGNLAVKMRHLKALGYTPVVFSEHELDNLLEEERTELVRSQIFPEHERLAFIEPRTEEEREV